MRNRMIKAKIAELERIARKHIDSVPYSVSLRWVFYRLLQNGIYSEKGDYDRWCAQASKFRHDGTWNPDMLEDSTRVVVSRGLAQAWKKQKIIDYIIEPRNLAGYFLNSHFDRQACYAELWFEARAMLGQFEQYTRYIVLRPFGGDYTIGPKYQAAKDLMKNAKRFGKPIKILYFGDCDKKGNSILASASTGPKGLMKWCDVPVEWVWCGLTQAQATLYKIPSNPDKPGEYQWEALTDAAAREIISHALEEHLDLSLIDTVEQEAIKKGKRFAAELKRRLTV